MRECATPAAYKKKSAIPPPLPPHHVLRGCCCCCGDGGGGCRRRVVWPDGVAPLFCTYKTRRVCGRFCREPSPATGPDASRVVLLVVGAQCTMMRARSRFSPPCERTIDSSPRGVRQQTSSKENKVPTNDSAATSCRSGAPLRFAAKSDATACIHTTPRALGRHHNTHDTPLRLAFSHVTLYTRFSPLDTHTETETGMPN